MGEKYAFSFPRSYYEIVMNIETAQYILKYLQLKQDLPPDYPDYTEQYNRILINDFLLKYYCTFDDFNGLTELQQFLKQLLVQELLTTLQRIKK